MKDSLTPAQIEDALHSNPDWKYKDGKLVREWSFRDFAESMKFVEKIAALAESAGHHPDIDIRYNRVLLGLVSHDAGGVTRRDLDLACRIDQLN